MTSDYCILVSSCDKYSDLWDNHFKLLFAHWEGEIPKIYLLTDKSTSAVIENVSIIVVPKEDFPSRLHEACDIIESKYVFLTLDDYYLQDVTKGEYFDYFVKSCIESNIDYLSVYNRKFTKKRFYSSHEKIEQLRLVYPYDVNLYPAIWKKEFLYNCTNSQGNPWEFEPQLTFLANELNGRCYFNISGCYNILDVVRKGKILNKAYHYLKKNHYKLPNRKRASPIMEIKESIANFLSWKLPRPIYRGIRKVAIFFGMKSYSNDVIKEKKNNSKK